MVLFPSYAKRHVRVYGDKSSGQSFDPSQGASGSLNDSEYWRHEWAKAEEPPDLNMASNLSLFSAGHVSALGTLTTPRSVRELARDLSGLPSPDEQQQHLINDFEQVISWAESEHSAPHDPDSIRSLLVKRTVFGFSP